MINSVVVVGRTCGDIELKTFESGDKVGELTLAIGERRKNKDGGYVDHTEFVRCRLWGKTAELAESYVPMGTMVGFQGKFVTDSWEKDGKKYFKSYVAVKELKFIPGGKTQNVGQSAQNSGQAGFAPKTQDDYLDKAANMAAGVNPQEIPF